jgi:SAM-dependent methyltransferase
MASVAEHYANHLAPIYSWMVGDFDAACAQADRFYTEIGLPVGNGHIAVDLGCGHGIHSVPLARHGYRVLALDTSSHLLNELNSRVGGLPITTIADDLMLFSNHLGQDLASLIVCMGDTLTHLPSLDAIKKLISDSVAKLTPDGMLTFAFRDYANHDLVGTGRFIPVRSDDRRILTCFLEYRSDTVIVHDIVQTFENSAWQMSVSAYTKLRLQPDAFVSLVESNGLSLVYKKTDRGMIYLAFRRPRAPNAG